MGNGCARCHLLSSVIERGCVCVCWISFAEFGNYMCKHGGVWGGLFIYLLSSVIVCLCAHVHSCACSSFHLLRSVIVHLKADMFDFIS